MNSSGQWLRPFRLETNSIPTSVTREMNMASCPAPLGSVLTGRPFSAMPRFSAAATRWDRRTGAESISTDISTP